MGLQPRGERPGSLAARRSWLVGILCALVAVVSVGWSNPAAAKKKVVVKAFSGRGGGTARASFVRAIRRRVRLISARKFSSTASNLGVESGPGGYADTCSKLRCSAVVVGKVTKRRRRYTVVVTVYNGKNGRAIGRRATKVRGARRLRRAGAALARACLRLIRKGSYRRGRKPKPEPDPPPEPPPKVEDPLGGPDDNNDRDKDDRDKDDRDRDKDDDDRDDDDDDDGRLTKSARRGKNAGLLEVSASIGLAMRGYELSGSDATKNSKYEGGMYPEFRVQARFFPLVLALKNFARYIGLGVSYSRHLSISTKLPTAASNDVSTSSQELLIDAIVKFPFNKKATSPVVAGVVGWGMRDFTLGKNRVLTSFNYRYIRFGLEGTVPFGNPLIAGHLAFDLRPLLAIGQEAIDSFGSKTGGLAWALRAGVTGRHKSGVTYFLTFEYLKIGTEFAGVDQNDVRVDTPDRAEVTSGSDSFIRVWVGTGYAM